VFSSPSLTRHSEQLLDRLVSRLRALHRLQEFTFLSDGTCQGIPTITGTVFGNQVSSLITTPEVLNVHASAGLCSRASFHTHTHIHRTHTHTHIHTHTHMYTYILSRALRAWSRRWQVLHLTDRRAMQRCHVVPERIAWRTANKHRRQDVQSRFAGPLED
jgi:hypothetical protein